MTLLFKKKNEADLRSMVLKVRVTKTECDKIHHAASIRKMPVSEYIRRTALGRKANVDYETDIILELRAVCAEMRALCAVALGQGMKPEELKDQLQPIVTHTIEAILRVSR